MPNKPLISCRLCNDNSEIAIKAMQSALLMPRIVGECNPSAHEDVYNRQAGFPI